jgi:deoxyadenosine/deoxycytidine kinase
VQHQFIVIEGPIGVGKTSLARRLAASTGAGLLRDPEADNPFLETFYNAAGACALHTQLDFLIRRYEALEALADEDFSQPLVSDFLFAKDRLFAELTLNDDELWIYDKVRARLNAELPEPDLLIYLQATPETLMDRIEIRGVGFEQRMASGYLQRLTDAYSNFFHDYAASPLLIVNTSDINFVDNQKDYDDLLEQIGEITAGRHFLNPLPA